MIITQPAAVEEETAGGVTTPPTTPPLAPGGPGGPGGVRIMPEIHMRRVSLEGPTGLDLMTDDSVASPTGSNDDGGGGKRNCGCD